MKIADHHTESGRFVTHLERKRRHGRRRPATWSWIVQPTAGSATPVFHRSCDGFDASPGFRRHSA